MEYAGEGSQAPLVSIRDGRFKFNHCELDPPQLFDLEADRLELSNLAAEPAQAERVKGFMARVRARRDPARLDTEVRQSQPRRWGFSDAFTQGRQHCWPRHPTDRAPNRVVGTPNAKSPA